MKKRYLLLENGSVYEGEAFGADVDIMAELVFNTGMSGYQESITDLSYRGEIIVFTYPLIGNYGLIVMTLKVCDQLHLRLWCTKSLDDQAIGAKQ